MRIRSLVVGSIAMLATLILAHMPAAAVQLERAIHPVTIEMMDFTVPEIAIVDENVAAVADSQEPRFERVPALAELGPVYDLARRTDGQSLQRYHMRC